VVILSLVTNLTLFTGLALALGALAARWWIVPADRAVLLRPSARLGLVAGGLLVVALVAVFARQLIEFRDPFSPWSDEARLLLGTGWGGVWRWGMGAALILPVAFLAAARGKGMGWVVATVVTIGLGVFPALTGHAAAGDLRLVTLPADALHVLAMGLWIGGLAVVLLLDRGNGGEREAAGESLLPVLIPRFSPLALGSVGVLVVSGLIGSWVHLESIGALFTTPYGRLLGLKVTLAAGVFLLGAVNFRRLLPRLSDAGGSAALRRSATREVALAVLVLAVTAVLVRTSPL
jgi:putative copper export protein